MSTQVTTTLFSIDELSSDAQAKALDMLREKEYNTDHEWWEFTLDAHKEALGFIGFYDVDISFSGFNSQGDGASFTARYDSIDINMDKLEQCHTAMYELMMREGALRKAMSLVNDVRMTARVYRSSHHYSHERTVSVDEVELCGGDEYEIDQLEGQQYDLDIDDFEDEESYDIAFQDINDKINQVHELQDAAQGYLTDIKNSLCQLIYSELDDEYEYLNSDYAMRECARGNDVKFLEYGSIAPYFMW